MGFPKKLRIAIDVMGGDYAPEREIAGAVEALREGLRQDLPLLLHEERPSTRDEVAQVQELA